MVKCRTQVFRDKDGNRFIFPSLIIEEGNEEAPSAFDITSQAFMLSMSIGSSVTLEKEWFEFDNESFPHVATELESRCFLHGAATTLIFEGPIFNEVKGSLQ